jgi:hypothetical protein
MRFGLDNGGSVFVEVEEDEPGVVRASRAREVIESASTSFGTALASVRDAAATALHQFRNMDVLPDEIQVEFGVRLNAQAGAVIAKTGVAGHLKVKLTCQRYENRREDEIQPDEKDGSSTLPGNP